MSKIVVTRSTTGTTWADAGQMAALKFPVTIQAVASSTIDFDVVWSNDGQTTETNHATIVGATATATGTFPEPVGAIGVNVNSVSGGSVTLHIVGS